MAELIGLLVFLACGTFMLNPANPVPNDKKNWKNLKNFLNSGYLPIHGSSENSDNGGGQ